MVRDMATLILARHGRTTANTGGVLAGRTKGVLLDEQGELEAQAAGERLAGLPLAALVTSPLERCRDTARAINAAQPTTLTVTRERGLLECDYGAWTGKPLKALAKERLWKVVQEHPSGAAFPDGESMAQMSARAVAAVRRWDAAVEADHGPDAAWVAVSHGDVIKAIIADALGMHLDAFQRLVVDPGSLSVIRYTPHRPFVVSVNSTAGEMSHLRPPRRRGRGARRRGDAVVGGGAGSGSTVSGETP
jgi:probable phosphomutase (TIGR03848 family)